MLGKKPRRAGVLVVLALGPSSFEDLLLSPCSRSERQLLLYSAEALAAGPSAVLGLDVAPSTLLPSYDPDTGLVLLTGKVGWGAQGALGRYGVEAAEASCFTAAIPLGRYPRVPVRAAPRVPLLPGMQQLHIARSPQGEPARGLRGPQVGPPALRPLVAMWANCTGP